MTRRPPKSNRHDKPLPDTTHLRSTPPYVADGDPHLAALHHGPMLALSDGGDGLQALREIIIGAPAHLNSGGSLLVEHGYDQAAAVRKLFADAGFAAITTRRDLEGDRKSTRLNSSH